MPENFNELVKNPAKSIPALVVLFIKHLKTEPIVIMEFLLNLKKLRFKINLKK
jgi:hypothetical protein